MNLNIILENYDYFVYDKQEIVVLDNRKSKNPKHNNLLMFGRISRTEEKSELVPIFEEDYDRIMRHYLDLKSAFLKEDK